MNYLLPPIGATGVFKLKEPLNNIINTRQNYKVIGIRSIKEMLENDEDVLTFVYLNQDLTEDDYNADLENDIPIVVLHGEDDAFYYIPANRLLSIPDITGKIFRYKTIAVDLGLVPDDQDFNFLIDEIKDMVMSYYGIETNPKVIDISSAYIYTMDEYKNFENNRKLNITNFKPCRVILKELDNKVQLMKLKIKTLLEKLNNQ